jgi:hypothetical protein
VTDPAPAPIPNGRPDLDALVPDGAAASSRPPPGELVDTPGAFLLRTDLAKLGHGRRAVDAIFRALPVIKLPDYDRPMIRADDYRTYIEEHTYRDDRVRPT